VEKGYGKKTLAIALKIETRLMDTFSLNCLIFVEDEKSFLFDCEKMIV